MNACHGAPLPYLKEWGTQLNACHGASLLPFNNKGEPNRMRVTGRLTLFNERLGGRNITPQSPPEILC